MKARILLIALLLGGGFYYLASRPAPPAARTSENDRPKARPAMWTGPDVNAAGLSADELSNIDIYKRAHNSTVNITSTVYRRGWFMELYPSRNAGSGFAVDEKGHILTNYHVVQGVERGGELVVTLPNNKKKFKAQLLERDPGNDLALIKVDASARIQPLRMGDSENLQVGQKVLAIGNPFGLEGTLTTGIISSLGRSIQDENQRELEGLIQTDAAINPGNSGGPLLDSQGNVIGINTAIYGPGGNIGIGFAMPISKAKAMLDDYQAGRRYAPPRLGVSVVYVSGGWAEALGFPEEGGLLVQGVAPGSSAAKAGIRGPREVRVIGGYEVGVGGDLIIEVDGKPCDRPDAISRALTRRRAGDTIELRLWRGGRAQTVQVTLSAASEDRL